MLTGSAPDRGPEPFSRSAQTPGPSAVAERAREQLKAIAAEINHHLRDPMAVVLGHSELLLAQADALPPDERPLLHAFDGAVRRLDDAVSSVCQLLLYAEVNDDRP